MKRTTTSLLAAVVLGLSITGVALAASSPTVRTGRAVSVSNTSETLTATVNPNGNETGVGFQYGITNAYGQSGTNQAVGAGAKPVTVKSTITGLTPGTVYHYHVFALNKAGSASGADRTFTTSGPPPAAVVTGPPVNVRKTVATVTGSVNPEGAETTWAVDYGLTTNYGVETVPAQPLAKVATSLPVSATLAGLAPATLFHYRIVAFHNGNVTSTGADATFFTEPARRPNPRLSAKTSPGRDRHRPYAFSTSGTIGGASFIPAASRCSGTVKVGYFLGKRRIGTVVAPVGPDCKFTADNSFRRVKAATPATIRIKIHFNGNGYIAPADRTNSVTAG
ncbi:MAG: fibronectin type III domain-containing protein [Solirubrobacteraceae bacterium]